MLSYAIIIRSFLSAIRWHYYLIICVLSDGIIIWSSVCYQMTLSSDHLSAIRWHYHLIMCVLSDGIIIRSFVCYQMALSSDQECAWDDIIIWLSVCYKMTLSSDHLCDIRWHHHLVICVHQMSLSSSKSTSFQFQEVNMSLIVITSTFLVPCKLKKIAYWYKIMIWLTMKYDEFWDEYFFLFF